MPYVMLDDCESTTGWTILGNDTENLAVSTVKVTGTYSLEFDKKDGTDNTIFAGAYKSVELDLSTTKLTDQICWECYVSDLTLVAYSFVRLGTDSGNYAEWRYDDSDHTAGMFTRACVKLGNVYIVGTGIDWRNVKYMVVGVAFDGVGNALANIRIDSVLVQNTILTV